MGKEIGGFDWDTFNIQKCQKHGVSLVEIEFIFSNDPIILVDHAHSNKQEVRYIAVGGNQNKRYIFIIFTLRQDKQISLIRVISARYMHKKELNKYII